MELPIHTQLCCYIGASADCARGYLFIDIFVGKSHSRIAVLSLCKLCIVIVGDFGNGIASLIYAVSYFVGNAPAEITAAYISSVLIGNKRSAVYHTRTLSPFNTDMIACRIHKCTAEHSLITDI